LLSRVFNPRAWRVSAARDHRRGDTKLVSPLTLQGDRYPRSLLWWQSGSIYQVYPRSFQDSDSDGVGDLRGIGQRLDYLQSLGIDGIWLSPIFRSPMADFGYDVADYTDVDPMFGTLADVDALIEGTARLSSAGRDQGRTERRERAFHRIQQPRRRRRTNQLGDGVLAGGHDPVELDARGSKHDRDVRMELAQLLDQVALRARVAARPDVVHENIGALDGRTGQAVKDRARAIGRTSALLDVVAGSAQPVHFLVGHVHIVVHHQDVSHGSTSLLLRPRRHEPDQGNVVLTSA
jgi:hypothetical protein